MFEIVDRLSPQADLCDHWFKKSIEQLCSVFGFNGISKSDIRLEVSPNIYFVGFSIMLDAPYGEVPKACINPNLERDAWVVSILSEDKNTRYSISSDGA